MEELKSSKFPSSNPSNFRVLVTGITGFLGSHVGKLLLEKGYKVRGTVRDKKNEKKLAPLKSLPKYETLELVEADLLKPESWEEAVKDCDYVMHVASPFPTKTPKNEDELIKPAVQGTLSVLKACAKYGKVKHVVVTSSVAAVMSGGKYAKNEYTEDDWSVLDSVPAYNKSKQLAEKAAWDFVKSLDAEHKFKLTTINPGFIFGPALINTDFSSGDVIRQILTGDLIALPKMHNAIVDVRDVALAHVSAIELPNTDGQRYLCVSKDHLWFSDISNILQKEFGKYGYDITTRNINYCFFRIAAICDRQAETVIPFWNREAIFRNDKIIKDLHINFISAEESIIRMAYSLIENGVVPDLIHKGEKQRKKE